MATSETTHALLQATDALAALKRSYERFWLGLERPEPERERERLRGVFRRLLTDIEGPANTALAFRVRSAQSAFRAFDELCERRNHDPNAGGPAGVRARAAATAKGSPKTTTAAPDPTAKASELASAHAAHLYETLVSTMRESGQVPPSKEKFTRQVEMYLARAAAEAPHASLRPELVFDPQGRAKLVIVDTTA